MGKETQKNMFFESVLSRRSGQDLLAAWIITGKYAGTKALFVWKEEQYIRNDHDESFPAEYEAEIQKLPRGCSGILDKADARIFLEPVAKARRLVICGAGHVSMALIRMGIMLDFEITVIEDREEFAAKAKEAGAHHVVCKPFEEALRETEGDLRTAFVIMTREHAYDVDCLRLILQKPCAYAGMMGSRSRSAQIRHQMLEEGYEARKVQQLYMPVGLPIGSRTPEEIAVSVIAQIIQVMNASDSGEGFVPGMLEELTRMSDEKGCPGILSMIVEKNGEGPRKPGTKMLVRKDGSFLGTVGGGYAEAMVLQTAAGMLREGCRDPRLIHVDMKKGAMYCGGETTVFLLPITSPDVAVPPHG